MSFWLALVTRLLGYSPALDSFERRHFSDHELKQMNKFCLLVGAKFFSNWICNKIIETHLTKSRQCLPINTVNQNANKALNKRRFSFTNNYFLAFIQLIWQILKYPQGWCIARRSLAIYLDDFNSPLFLLEFRRITDSSYQPAIPRVYTRRGIQRRSRYVNIAMVAKFWVTINWKFT